MKYINIIIIASCSLLLGMEQPDNFENYLQFLPQPITVEVAKEAIKKAIAFSDHNLKTAIYNIRQLQMITKEQWYPIMNSPAMTQFIIDELDKAFGLPISNLLSTLSVKTFDKKIFFASLLATKGAIEWLEKQNNIVSELARNLEVVSSLYGLALIDSKPISVNISLIKHLFLNMRQIAQKVRPQYPIETVLIPSEYRFLIPLVKNYKTRDEQFLNSFLSLIDKSLIKQLFRQKRIVEELIKERKSAEILEIVLKLGVDLEGEEFITYVLERFTASDLSKNLATKYLRLLVRYGARSELSNERIQLFIKAGFGERFLQELIQEANKNK